MTEEVSLVVSLLVAGYVLGALEAFVIPGFGVAGIASIFCLIAGCYESFHAFGAALGSAVVLLVLGSVSAFMWWFPRSSYGRRVVHSTSLEGAEASPVKLSVGEQGVAESDLRPSGIGRFGAVRDSVVTDGDFIRHGTAIRVKAVEGARVVVDVLPAATRSDVE